MSTKRTDTLCVSSINIFSLQAAISMKAWGKWAKRNDEPAREDNKWMKGGLLNNQSSQVPFPLGDLS